MTGDVRTSQADALKRLIVGHVGVVVHHLLVGFVHPRLQALQHTERMSARVGSGARTWRSSRSTDPVSLVDRPRHDVLVVHHEAVESQIAQNLLHRWHAQSAYATGRRKAASQTCLVRGSTSMTSSPSTIEFLSGIRGSSWCGKYSPLSCRYALWRSICAPHISSATLRATVRKTGLTRYTICPPAWSVWTKRRTRTPSDFSATQKLRHALAL